MSLDPQLLAAARAAAAALQQGEAALAPLRRDYCARLQALHAAGATLRQIAAALGLSHQRVHQLVHAGGLAGNYLAQRAAPVAESTYPCCLCGEREGMSAGKSVCALCRVAGQALLTGQGETLDRALRLVRRHQRPHCVACGRQPGAGEAFVAGPAGAICPACLDR